MSLLVNVGLSSESVLGESLERGEGVQRGSQKRVREQRKRSTGDASSRVKGDASTYLREPKSDLLESVLNGVRSVADVSSHVWRR